MKVSRQKLDSATPNEWTYLITN